MTEWKLRPKVLLYGFRDPERRRQITDWLNKAGVLPVEVPPAQYHQTLGALLALPGFDPGAGVHFGPAFREEMLVMFGLPEETARRFLRFFREAGLAPVALKAMATPTNLQWSSLALYEALQEEHAYFQAAKEKRERT